MRENNVLIICATVLICVLIVAATFIIISGDDNIFDNILNVGSDNSNSNNGGSNSQSSSNSESGSGSSTDNVIDTIYWVKFYSDGNPGTGEGATLYVGNQHAGQSVQVSMDYSRDGYSFDPAEYGTYTVSDDGTIYIYISTPMNRYPDKCIIRLNHNGNNLTRTCYLGTHKGTQQVTF